MSRFGGIDSAVRGKVGRSGGQLSRGGVDGRLNVARGGVDVAIQIELQNNARGAQLAGGRHLRDTRDASELAFQRRGHRRCHGFGACAGQSGANKDGRKIDVRQSGYGKKIETHAACKQDGDTQQRSGNGPPDEWRGNVHLVFLSPLVQVRYRILIKMEMVMIWTNFARPASLARTLGMWDDPGMLVRLPECYLNSPINCGPFGMRSYSRWMVTFEEGTSMRIRR